MPAKARTKRLLLPVTNDSEHHVEDLLAQVAGRFFRAFCLLDRRDALKKKTEIARVKISYKKVLQRNAQ
jgi:hypothetical protein